MWKITRSKCLFVVASALALMLMYLYTSKAPTAKISNVETRAYDWILTSNKRSGSSITGQLLGHRQDTFYWFEPLISLQRHFWSQDKICYDDDDRNNCRPPVKGELTTDDAIGVVQQIMNCNFSSLARTCTMKGFMTRSHSGIHWTQYEECLQRHDTNDTDVDARQKCLTQQESLCKAASHRGIKILRLFLVNMVRLLDRNANLKVIHLFRDPRAIFNSRETTNWFDLKKLPNAKFLEGRVLCKRMLYEAHTARVLRQMYPGRFAIVFYEDLFSNLKQKLKGLYSFLGVHESEKHWEKFIVDVVDKNSHNASYETADKDFKYWWRTRMDYTFVKTLDTVCKDVYDILGFVPVKNESMLTDMTIDLHKFKSEYLIENISSGKSYDSL